MEIKITGLIPFINILFHKIALIACEMIITHLMKTVSLLQVLIFFFFLSNSHWSLFASPI